MCVCVCLCVCVCVRERERERERKAPKSILNFDGITIHLKMSNVRLATWFIF